MITLSLLRLMPTMATAENAELNPNDFAVSKRARGIWRVLIEEHEDVWSRIVADADLKWLAYRLTSGAERFDPLDRLLTLVVRMAAHDVPETFWRRMHLLFGEIIDECYTGAPKLSRAELDRIAFAAEQRGNAFKHERLLDTDRTADELDAEAAALEAEIAADIVVAKHLRRDARRMRAGLVAA